MYHHHHRRYHHHSAAIFTITTAAVYGTGVVLLNFILPDNVFPDNGVGGMNIRSLVSQLWAALVAIVVLVLYIIGGYKLSRILPPAVPGAPPSKTRRGM